MKNPRIHQVLTSPRPLPANATEPVSSLFYFMAIRRTPEGNEWLDTVTLGWDQDDAMGKALATNKIIPQWAKENPVIRVVAVDIVERKEIAP